LKRLARLAVERGCGRMEWAVLDWNAPAIGFYRSLGARPMDEWTVYRLDGAHLARVAEAEEFTTESTEGTEPIRKEARKAESGVFETGE
jgi:hypothetical protein